MKTLPIGTTGVAAHDISCVIYRIPKGTRVKIIDYGPRGYDVETEDGVRIIETGYDSVIPDDKM